MKIQNIATVCLAAVIVLAGCSGGIPNTNAATVNGVSIDQKAYLAYLEQKSTMLVQGPNGPITVQLVGTPGFQAVKDLVVNQEIQKMAKDAGVLPTSADVDNEIKFEQQSNPNLVTDALAQGISLDLLRSQILVDLCKFNLQTKGITVTPDQVNQFIAQNKDSFITPPQAQLQMIVVKSAADEKAVDSALNQGKPFETVAASYSIDPNGRQSHYRYGISNEKQMPPPLVSIVEKTQVLHTTAWIQSKQGFVKFYVQGKTPATPVKITDNIKEQVKRRMMLQEGAKTVNLDILVAKQLVKDIDKIQVTGKSNGNQWKTFMTTLQQSPLNSMVTPPNGAAPAPTAPNAVGTAATQPPKAGAGTPVKPAAPAKN